MKIRILVTGGTIDDLEYDSAEKQPKSHKTLIPDLIERGNFGVDYEVDVLFLKDSKFVNDDDRKIIMNRCRECSEDRIVVTHGTMTMPETAKYLGRKNLGKTIVLTGSLIPANKENSDALENVSLAVTSVQKLSQGVYVAMNGKIFSWDNVKKNMETGIFGCEK